METIQHITTPLSLIAFIAAILATKVWRRLTLKKELISSAPESKRAELIEASLETYHLKNDNLTREQKFQLVLKVMDLKISRIKLYVNAGIILTLILAPTTLIGYWITKDFNKQLTQLTVSVHDKKNKEIILRQGQVVMNIRGEIKKEPITDNGQAFFQNLPVGDSVNLNVDFSEPYKSINPDSFYIIETNKNFELLVSLQGIDKVYGKVLYKEFPLQDVNVQIDSLFTNTDKLGNFRFNIPEQMQKKQYLSVVYKRKFQNSFSTSISSN